MQRGGDEDAADADIDEALHVADAAHAAAGDDFESRVGLPQPGAERLGADAMTSLQ